VEERARECDRKPVLPCPCLCDEFTFAHEFREQALPHRVVGLVCAAVHEIFTFKKVRKPNFWKDFVHGRAASGGQQMFSVSALIRLVPVGIFKFFKCGCNFTERLHQKFRDKHTAKFSVYLDIK